MEIKIDKQRQHLFYLSIPALLAILISGVIDVQIISNHPFEEVIGNLITNENLSVIVRRVVWNLLQLLPAFLFGSLSDTHLRKDYLVYVQIFGVLFGIAFLVIGFKSWIVFLFALTYNPLSVARAALLDNYKKVTAVEIISITYIFKLIPWVFIVPLTSVSIQTIFYFLVPALAINVFLSFFFFRDRFRTKERMEQFEESHKEEKECFIRGNKWAILMNVAAFALAETTFYLFWTFFDEHPALKNRLFLATFITILGLLAALLYRKVPKLSTVARLYFILVCTTVLVFILAHYSGLAWTQFLIISITINCAIGGIYLPIATTALIKLSGTKRRATGSAFAETSDVIALILASFVMSFNWINSYNVFIAVIALYILASFLQIGSQRFVVHKSGHC